MWMFASFLFDSVQNITSGKSTHHVFRMKLGCLFCGIETAIDENRTDHLEILDQQQVQQLCMNQEQLEKL